MAISPAWGAWMGALTEQRDRERYFAVRSTCVSIAMLAAFVWAGLHLRDGAAVHDLSHTYALLFSVGLVARLGSTAMLIKQADPWPATRDSLKRVLARTRLAVRSEGFRWPILLALWLFGAHVSIPFYAPYMLKTLGIGYEGFALLCAVQLLTKSLAFPFACRVATRLGLERMLAFAIGLTSMTTYLWGSQTSLATLVLAQALSGVAWASYDFASFQLLLRSAKPSQRVEFLAMSASLGGFMQLSGALLGSFLLARLGLRYRELFLVSAGLRALPLLLIVPAALDRRAERSRELARD
jgi:hypothetical protein